jgi:hypothetical protein
MANTAVSPPDSGHAVAPSGKKADGVFQSRFSAEERRQLMLEDREAQLGISAILACLIATGMTLGVISVLLIRYLGI